MEKGLRKLTRELGFQDASITALKIPVSHQQHYLSLCEQNLFGRMSYLYRNIRDRLLQKPQMHYSHALVLLYPYHYRNQSSSFGKFKIAKYAQGKDYHYAIKEKLYKIEEHIKKSYPEVGCKSVIDTFPLAERSLAYNAGLGWIGKNSMLISKKLGSFTFIGVILLSGDLSTSQPSPYPHSYCGSCTRCIDICPTQAIAPDGGLNPSQCISYFNKETKDDHGPLHGWAVGCDLCQDICPWNQKESAFQAQPESWQFDAELENKLYSFRDDEISFRSAFKEKAFYRIGAHRFKQILLKIDSRKTSS